MQMNEPTQPPTAPDSAVPEAWRAAVRERLAAGERVLASLEIDLDARLRDVRGVGGPPLVSFVVTPQPRTTWLLRTFGDAWVIACYMGFAGAVISVHALSVCWGEAQHRKRMMAGKARRERSGGGGGGGGERRDRLGSANSRSSDGAPESAGPSPEGKKNE
jgi:hypothetical protein